MSKKPILYGTYGSPSCRSVLLLLKALQIDYEFCFVSVFRGQQNTAEYFKKNPALTIPTLEIGPGQFIGDSHAIMAYLVGRYGKVDDPLYPKDLYKRAKIDQLLHFENGVLFLSCLKQPNAAVFLGLQQDIPSEKMKEIEKAYDMLEAFFGEHAFVAGDEMTIADFSCYSSMATLIAIHSNLDEAKHPKIAAWLAHMNSLPYAQEIMEHKDVVKVIKRLQQKLAKL